LVAIVVGRDDRCGLGDSPAVGRSSASGRKKYTLVSPRAATTTVPKNLGLMPFME
jgi:hypothetical protein